MEPILQASLPYPLPGDRLPGVAPLDPGDWLIVDEAFAGQMALRDALISQCRDRVLALDDAAAGAAVELLDLVLALLRETPGYRCRGAEVIRPDGGRVRCDPGDALASLGRLVQEDFCLLEKRGGEHVLTGAVLCFPAGWTLSEKFLRPLSHIHAPVAAYDGEMARRVQRMFDAIRVEQPLWRANGLNYDDPALFAPRPQSDPRPPGGPHSPYFRSERQSILRLPESGAVVFSIHTFMLRRADLAPAAGRRPVARRAEHD